MTIVRAKAPAPPPVRTSAVVGGPADRRARADSVAPAKRAPDVDDALRAAEAKRKKPDMGLGPARHLRRRAEATTATRAPERLRGAQRARSSSSSGWLPP